MGELRPTVLVVDDDALVRKALRELFESVGLQMGRAIFRSFSSRWTLSRLLGDLGAATGTRFFASPRQKWWHGNGRFADSVVIDHRYGATNKNKRHQTQR